jgi:hypothetical protein
MPQEATGRPDFGVSKAGEFLGKTAAWRRQRDSLIDFAIQMNPYPAQ